MLIIIPANTADQVTVIRTMDTTLAACHDICISRDGKIVKNDYIIHKDNCDSTWSHLNHPSMSDLLVPPRPQVVDILNMPVTECIASIIDDTGVWNEPSGKHSNNLFANVIVVVDEEKTIFMQDLHDADEHIPMWANRYVRDYYNTALTDLEVSLTHTALHMYYGLKNRVKKPVDEIVLIDPDASDVSTNGLSDGMISIDTSFVQVAPDDNVHFQQDVYGTNAGVNNTPECSNSGWARIVETRVVVTSDDSTWPRVQILNKTSETIVVENGTVMAGATSVSIMALNSTVFVPNESGTQIRKGETMSFEAEPNQQLPELTYVIKAAPVVGTYPWVGQDDDLEDYPIQRGVNLIDLD